MPEPQLAYLFDRYFRGIATPDEREALMELLAKEGNEEDVIRLMEKAWEDFQPGHPVFGEETSARILHYALTASSAGQPPASSASDDHIQPVFPVRRLFTFTRVAAAILLLVAGAFYWQNRLTHSRRSIAVHNADTSRMARDIPPGTDGAILTLADGRRIVLDSVQNGELSTQGNTKIVKQGGRLAYMPQGGAHGAISSNGEILYNTMNIPRGKQYQLILPDGTHVWLNAASSIRYPASFTGKERKVEITGEAYFEVAKNIARPFRVKVGEAEVEVLGTHFNIMAYEEEATVRTTLLEGAVKVTRPGASHLLRPGQEAQLNRQDEQITVIDDAPLTEAVAWKNGLFFFNRASLATVMRQIARWYDVQIVYEGEIPQMEFGGKISRNSNVSEVLKILELSKVHFRIDGKKIVVMP
ncbi:MAG TPA: FecR domain-containing protein [Puia sp.]|jgi:ferric-dicitrate binding protein FerR (iron transport regulator)